MQILYPVNSSAHSFLIKLDEDQLTKSKFTSGRETESPWEDFLGGGWVEVVGGLKASFVIFFQ